MDDTARRRVDALLDLLAEEVARRLAERPASGGAAAEPPLIAPAATAAWSAPEAPPASAPPAEPAAGLPDDQDGDGLRPTSEAAEEPAAEFAPELAASTPSHAAALMARLALGILAIVVLINIPLNTQGKAFARSIPNATALVIANGLVVKEATSPEVWVYRDGAFHWITSLDAFQFLGYRWGEVHIVQPGFLSQYNKGRPVYVVLKCESSPNIYRVQDGRKRWIVDIPAFVGQGYVWQDVRFVPCSDLYNLPSGDSIPPGRGSPP